MKHSPIPPHPVLTPALIEQLEITPTISFSSSRTSPGEKGKWGEQYTLGHDSDWDPSKDELEVSCCLDDIRNTTLLFGPHGVAPRSATLALALEWLSIDSGCRLLGEPAILELPKQSDTPVPVKLKLTLPANTARGTGTLSLQLLLASVGTLEEGEKGLARLPGFRFGTLGAETRLIVDGSGSLFPVVSESLGVDKPLWLFTQDWSDPLEDEFSTVWLSLSLNTDHPAFPLLREQESGAWSPLFCQVITAWMSTFLLELKAEMGNDFNPITFGRPGKSVPGSIVDAAASMVKRGNLDCTSPGALISTIQSWIDSTARPPLEAQ